MLLLKEARIRCLWNKLLMLIKEIRSSSRRRQEVKGRAGKPWLNENMLDNGLSVGSVTREWTVLKRTLGKGMGNYHWDIHILVEADEEIWGISSVCGFGIGHSRIWSQLFYLLNVFNWKVKISKSQFPRLWGMQKNVDLIWLIWTGLPLGYMSS